jgi:hypothetical protein
MILSLPSLSNYYMLGMLTDENNPAVLRSHLWNIPFCLARIARIPRLAYFLFRMDCPT